MADWLIGNWVYKERALRHGSERFVWRGFTTFGIKAPLCARSWLMPSEHCFPAGEADVVSHGVAVVMAAGVVVTRLSWRVGDVGAGQEYHDE